MSTCAAVHDDVGKIVRPGIATDLISAIDKKFAWYFEVPVS